MPSEPTDLTDVFARLDEREAEVAAQEEEMRARQQDVVVREQVADERVAAAERQRDEYAADQQQLAAQLKSRVERDRQLAGLLERAACTCEGEAWTCPRCAALELLSSG